MAKLGDKKAAPKQAVQKPKSTSKLIVSNRTAGLTRKRVVAHGPPGAGKTFLAGTLSKAWPSKLPSAKWNNLKDALWIAFDSEATVGMLEQKIEVDTIDASQLLTEEDVLDVLEDITDAVYDAVNKDKSLVVVDTVSKLDKVLGSYWNDNAPTTKSGEKDGFAIWREVLATHRRFHSNFNSLPCDIVWLCHSKYRVVPDGQAGVAAQGKQRASATPGMADIDMDLTGQALNIYRQDTSLVLSIQAMTVPGKGVVRHVHTQPHAGFEAKNRFQSSLAAKEEPHLGKMFGKIEKRLKA